MFGFFYTLDKSCPREYFKLFNSITVIFSSIRGQLWTPEMHQSAVAHVN